MSSAGMPAKAFMPDTDIESKLDRIARSNKIHRQQEDITLVLGTIWKQIASVDKYRLVFETTAS